MQEHPDREYHNLNGKTRSLSLLLSLGALAGVLIWAKLRLVTDIPRSAYAVPREHEDPSADDSQNQSTDTDRPDAEPLKENPELGESPAP